MMKLIKKLVSQERFELSTSCLRGSCSTVELLARGTPGGIRTPDLVVRTDPLYPLSYRGVCTAILLESKFGCKERALLLESLFVGMEIESKRRNKKKLIFFCIFLIIIFAVLFLVKGGFFREKLFSAFSQSPQSKKSTKGFENNWFPKEKPLNSNAPPPVLYSRSAISIDLTTNETLYAKNIHLRVPVASTLKIMTAIVALENSSLDKIITVSDHAARMEPDIMGLYPNEKLTVKDLLYGLLLVSGNDAAVALAQGISGSEKEFVSLMNSKAQSLGLNDTNFINSTGLDVDFSSDQYSSAYDLAVLSQYALNKFHIFGEIVKTKNYFVAAKFDEDQNHKYFYLNNTSPMVNYPGFKGIKPGFTPDSKLSLVSLIEKEGHDLLTVVLGTPDRRGETEALIVYSYQSLKYNNLN